MSLEFGVRGAAARPAAVLRARDRRDLDTVAARIGAGDPPLSLGRDRFVLFLPRGDIDAVLIRLAAAVDAAGGVELIETRMFSPAAAAACGPFVLAPPGAARPGPGTIVLVPGTGFGSGGHPSTRIAVALLAEAFRRFSPASVLDAGCGSGILSLAAARLGAGRVLGVEVDREAAAEARENVRANGLAGRVEIRAGDAAGVEERFALVVANMTPAVLAGLIPGLAARAGELMLVSGFRGRAGDDVASRLAAAGFAEDRRREEDGWKGILARRA